MQVHHINMSTLYAIYQNRKYIAHFKYPQKHYKIYREIS